MGTQEWIERGKSSMSIDSSTETGKTAASRTVHTSDLLVIGESGMFIVAVTATGKGNIIGKRYGNR